MKLVIFGLTISSSWGNGHATLWRALLHALRERGHRVTFFGSFVGLAYGFASGFFIGFVIGRLYNYVVQLTER